MIAAAAGCAAVTAVAIFGNWSAAARVLGGVIAVFIRHNPEPRARPNRRILTTFHVRLGQSGLCANLLQKHRTWRADPHAGSQSLICARCLVGKSATRRGLGMGVRCRYMAGSTPSKGLIQEYLQVP